MGLRLGGLYSRKFMATKPISQKKFAKGIVPTTSILSQTPGSLQRASNLLLAQRGALVTCDGSFTIGVVSPDFPLILVIGVFNDLAAGVYPFYPVLASQVGTPTPTLQLFIGYPGTPATVVKFFFVAAVHFVTVPLMPALLAPGDPMFADAAATITDYDPSATTGTVTSTTPPNPNTQSILFSGWPATAIPGGSTVTANIDFNATSSHAGGLANGVISFDYSVDGGVTYTNGAYNSGAFFPSFAATAQFTILGLTDLSLLFIRANAFAAHFSGAGTATTVLNVTNIFAEVSAVSTLSPYGGIVGKACLIPEILQFTAKTILILGNGLPPQVVDCTLLSAATAAPLTNTFTANYPAWQPSVAWVSGNQISVIIAGTTYLFTATQGGVSGTVAPTFSATLGSTVTDNQVIWRNDGAVSTSPAPRGAAHGIIYAGSLWLANTSPQTTSDNLDGPTVLKMSDSNNVNSWNPLNVAFIGRDDGTQITGLATFTIAEAGIAPTGSLVVFKEFSTFQIFGVFGATDFAITQAQTDLGCIGPRSIQFLPGFGIARLTHLGFALFDGVRDKLISEEIRPYLFGGEVQQADIIGVDFSFAYFAKGVQSTTPPMYFCVAPILTNTLGYGDAGYGDGGYGDSSSSGAMQRVFCYDLVLKAWMIIDLPWPISALTSVRVGEGKPLLLAGRSDIGTVERLQSNDVTWDSGTSASAPVEWSARLNDIFLEGSSQRAFFRQLTLRGQSLDPTLPAMITVSLTLDGIDYPPIDYFIEPQPGSTQFQIDVDIMVNAQVAHVALSGIGRLVIDAIDWAAVPKAGRKVMG